MKDRNSFFFVSVIMFVGMLFLSTSVVTAEQRPFAITGARIFDARGKRVIPGLIDAHIHFFQSAGLFTRPDVIDLTHIVSHKTEHQRFRERLSYTFTRYLCSGRSSYLNIQIVPAGHRGVSNEYHSNARTSMDRGTQNTEKETRSDQDMVYSRARYRACGSASGLLSCHRNEPCPWYTCARPRNRA